MNAAELRNLKLGDLAALFAAPAAPAAEPPRYADLKQFGPGVYRKALLAIKAGELEAFEPARRKYLVLADDFHAWLESEQHRVKPETGVVLNTNPVQSTDEIGELIEINRSRQRKRVGAK